MTTEQPAPSAGDEIVAVRDLVKHYRTRGRGTVHAVDGVTFSVAAGETLGLVGESGCGKSTTARLLVQLERPTSGQIVVGGVDLATAGRAQRKELRRTIQMVFQDPYASLDPRIRVGEAIGEVLRVHRLAGSASGRRVRVRELLSMVGLSDAMIGRYPHELSGGQRQRVGIARALAVEPRVLVLDEAVSALDVSVRAEVMNLLARLRRDLGLTYVFISHDLGMVRHIADRIAVMYLGQIVEVGPWQPVSDAPAHPYTVALQSAVPVADPVAEAGRLPLTVSGEVPDAARPPTGCRFHPRCPLVEEVCRTQVPELAHFGDAHLVSCHVVSREGRGATAVRSRPMTPGPRRERIVKSLPGGTDPSTPLGAGVELLPRLRGLAPSLVPSQRRVAEQILADPSNAATLTISELAAAAATSETTVVRLCRQLGVRGYRDLRVALAGEGGRARERAGSREIDPDIAASDSLDVVIAKITYADSEAILDTARLLDRGELGAVVDALVAAPRVDVFGVGASAFVAMDLQQKLHRIGLISFSWADQHAALTAAALLRPGDVAIGVSHTGSTKDTVETIDLARANGAITVALTSVPRSPLADAVHHRLITASRETTFRSGAMGSRIAALSVVDVLFVAVAQRRYQETMAALEATRRAVAQHRFDGEA